MVKVIPRVKYTIPGMKAHLIDTHLLVPRSRSSTKVKVNNQGHVSQEMDISVALVFHNPILFTIEKKKKRFRFILVSLLFKDQLRRLNCKLYISKDQRRPLE